MTTTVPTIQIRVDPTNPGQFFACCGLLELADRLCNGAEGWFERDGRFLLRSASGWSLSRVLQEFKNAALSAAHDDIETEVAQENTDDEDDEDEKARPLSLALGDGGAVFLLDWWVDKSLKPWAGSMNVRVIFRAMVNAIDTDSPDPLGNGSVVFDPVEGSGKGRRKPQKREPFYFDARRGLNARALDIGFMPDSLAMTTIAFPAVEALCLVGLQRFRPRSAGIPRVFDYCTWSVPMDPIGASVAACGELPSVCHCRFRFENAFRTTQKKHKAFTAAKAITTRNQ